MISCLLPRAYKTYLALPILGPLLDDFTQRFHQRGYTPGTIRNQLRSIRHIIAFLQKEGVQSTAELTHLNFENAWQHFHHNCPIISSTVRRLEQFLDETHRLPPPPPMPKTRSDEELGRFADYLKNVRGLVNTTIREHLRYLGRFLDFICFETNKTAMGEMTLKQIEEFIGQCAKSLNRYSLQHVVGYLRAFLRFEYSRDILQSPFHEMIDAPRIYRLEKLPRSLPWTIVNKLLLSIDRTDAHGIRNYAMLLLIATYGLRTCEVVSLTLDDINWRNGTIRKEPGSDLCNVLAVNI